MSSIIEFLKQLGVYPFFIISFGADSQPHRLASIGTSFTGDYQQGQSLGCWSERAPSLAALL